MEKDHIKINNICPVNNISTLDYNKKIILTNLAWATDHKTNFLLSCSTTSQKHRNINQTLVFKPFKDKWLKEQSNFLIFNQDHMFLILDVDLVFQDKH